MVRDPAAGHLLVFGGRGAGTFGDRLADTWQWNGQGWIDATPASGNPPGRVAHAMAYHAGANRAVIFGGSDGSDLADTWTWDGASWIRASPEASPPARSGHAMAYRAAAKRVVLFGGEQDGGLDPDVPLADTWVWDGASWAEVSPASGDPSARSGHAMAHDAARGRVVLFGGAGGEGPLGDTWEWDGTSWVEVTPASGNPPARSGHAMAYDATRRRVVLTGGLGDEGDVLEDTWEWDGAAWNEVPTGGDLAPELTGHAMAYHATGKTTVVFGGTEDERTNDTLAFRYRRAGDPGEACRLGTIDYDGDGVQGCDDPDCWGLCTPLCPPDTSCAPNAPVCGDGTCNGSLESCRLCPGDCGPCPELCGDAVCDAGEDTASCPGDCR